MDTISSSVRPQTSTAAHVNSNSANIVDNKSISYSAPASPASSINGDIAPAPSSPAPATVVVAVAVLSGAVSNSAAQPANTNGTSAPPTVSFSNNLHSAYALPLNSTNSSTSNATSGSSSAAHSNNIDGVAANHLLPCTPKKSLADADMLQRIRAKLRTPGGACELQALRLECAGDEPVNVIKDRYLISTRTCQITPAIAAKTPASYRHLIDLTASSLRCTDVFTEQEYLCKIINEPLHKVQRAYFQLQQAGDEGRSSLYNHVLIRGVHDIVPQSKQRTYLIIAPPQQHEGAAGVYEDLHTYIRNKRRLCEAEARALFHQICETVRLCHRNGIILRDLKLKRFYFIDEARTKLQYESLEGSMILDDPQDDTLSDKIGCPLYTAPELLCPNPTYRGKPADMWSLGVILYTMLVGQYPFYEKGNCNLITIIRHCHVQIPMTLSRSVRWLLLLLLRKNHEERMQAEHVFLSPWLKEQRPYYMYISVDVEFSDDEDDEQQTEAEEEEEEATAMAEQQDADMQTATPNESSDDAVVDCTDKYSATPALVPTAAASVPVANIEDCNVDCDMSVEPLDYSRRTLQVSANDNARHTDSSDDDDDDSDDDDDDGDVEMG